MERSSRRRFLALAGGGFAAGIAGCTDSVAEYLGPEDEGEFLVVSTTLSHSPGSRLAEAEYPDDIVARVTVSNRRATRERGRLEMELRYAPEDGDGQMWRKTDEVELTGGASLVPTYLFESVYQSGSEFPDDYEFTAEVIELADDGSE